MADEVRCPRCGARGDEHCSTASGRDHAARIRAEREWRYGPTEKEADRG